MAREAKQLQQGSHRVNLRLRSDVYEVVRRLAAHKETSIGGFVQETIEGMHRNLAQLLATVDEADHVRSEQQGLEVLDQLRAMAVHARAEADRLDAYVDRLQEELRQEVAAARTQEEAEREHEPAK